MILLTEALILAKPFLISIWGWLDWDRSAMLEGNERMEPEVEGAPNWPERLLDGVEVRVCHDAVCALS